MTEQDYAARVPGPCIFPGCVSRERHHHNGFPGGYDDPADPEGPPIPFTAEPAPGVRDYNGAILAAPAPSEPVREAVFDALTALRSLASDATSAADALSLAINRHRAALAAPAPSEPGLRAKMEAELDELDAQTRSAAEKGGDFTDGAEWVIGRLRLALAARLREDKR